MVIGVILAVVGGGFWMSRRNGSPKSDGENAAVEKAAGEKSAGEEGEKTRVTHDEKGRTVIQMDDETQGNAGLLVAKPVAAQLSPEVKGYGRVLDPTALAAIATEWATAQAAYTASSNELVRLKTLAGQGNAPERALQTGAAAALRDQLAVQSTHDRLVVAWGRSVAGHTNLASFVDALISGRAVLVRIDVPAGEAFPATPTAARLVTLSGQTVPAEFLGAPASVDAQTQGQGFIFLAKTAPSALLPAQALTGYLQVPGEPLTGVKIPREAVVRVAGEGWIYVLGGGSDAFTRMPVMLDRPIEGGWFIAQGLSTNENVVVTGAQTLLSEELKATIKAD